MASGDVVYETTNANVYSKQESSVGTNEVVLNGLLSGTSSTRMIVKIELGQNESPLQFGKNYTVRISET